MKIRPLHRDDEKYASTSPGELKRFLRNPDPHLHPFQRAREYTRGVVAVKMDKMFAKPFVGALEGHTDGVKCIARAYTQIATVYSGSCNGEVCIWNLAAQVCKAKFRAHEGFVRGLCLSTTDSHLFSAGDDRLIKQWKLIPMGSFTSLDVEMIAETETNRGLLDELGDPTVAHHQTLRSIGLEDTPTTVYTTNSPVTSLDHHWKKSLFMSTGETVDIWDEHRSTPLHSFEWGAESAYCGRFNPSETSLLAAGLGDNSVALYDLRGKTPIRKTLMKMRTNAIAWNPMEPLNFTVASEDHNLYTFDLRKLTTALVVHRDFVNAVMDVDYSPTGKEFVGGSFDGTVRLFKAGDGRSRDVYHTRRMQNVLSCRFSGDARFVVSGSADMCLRIWKADASAPLGPRSFRERKAFAYRRALQEKFGHVKEIKRIARHHHVPKLIKKIQDKKRIMTDAKQKREANRLAHSRPDAPKPAPTKKKSIYREIE